MSGDLVRRWWPLLAIVAVGLVLRVLVMVALLPSGHHPDEPRNLNAAASMARESSLDYEQFSWHMSYPGLMYNLGAATFRVWAAARDTIGGHDSLAESPFVEQTAGNAKSPVPPAVVAMRTTMLAFSVATIFAAAALGFSVTGRRSTAFVAAAFVSLSAVDIELGGTFTPDPTTGALNTAVLLGCIALLRRGSLRRYVAVGAVVGLAVSAKYSGVLVASAVAVAHVARTRGRPWREFGWLAAAAATSLLAFTLVSPMTVLDWDTAWAWIGAEQEHYRTGHPGWEGGVPAFYASTLFRMFGPALILTPFAFLIGRRERQLLSPVAAFVALYLVTHVLYIVRFERFMLALTGAVAVLVAVGLHGVLERLPARPAQRFAVFGLALTLPAVMAAATLVRAYEDPWSDASRWIEENVPPGTAVAVDSFAAWVDPDVYEVHAGLQLINAPVEAYEERGVEFFVSAAAQYERYDPRRYPEQYAAYRRLLDAACPKASFTGNNQTITVFGFGRC